MQETELNLNAAAAGDGRDETRLERLDRNLEELTGELRVVVTGVQVLFAFLLIVPFDSGFAGIGPFERGVYFVTLLLAALAAICTIAPSAYHRVLFRHDDKHHLVFVANRVVIAGLVFLALAMCGCLLLVATKLFGGAAGAITAGIATIPFIALWFAAPLRRRAGLGPGDRRQSGRRPGGEHTTLQTAQPDKVVRYHSTVGVQEHLRVDAVREQDRVVLRLSGELDLASAPILVRALEDPEIGAAALLLLDLDELQFVDSSGLRVILLAHEHARERGQDFAITAGSPQVQRLLSITSVTEHLRVVASPDELPV
jgi:anti-anti-sigma factor